MINLSPKQKLYLIEACFLAAFILIFIAIIFPLIGLIKSSNIALKEQEIASENFYKNQANMESSKKSYKQIKGEMTDQATFLPKDEALKFIIATEKIARETGNSQNISVTNANEKTDEETALKLQIMLSGNFYGLLNFLIQMENAPYFNDIDSLQINRIIAGKDSENKTGDINSIINLSAYYQ